MTVPEQHDEAVKRQQPGPEGHRTPAQRIRGNRRSLELTALIIVLFLINFLWSSHTATTAAAGRAQIEQQQIDADAKLITALQKSIASSCDFWYPLTSVPVTVVPSTGKASELSVKIVAGARESYQGQCSPPHPVLPPPDPSFTRWARFYHLPVTP